MRTGVILLVIFCLFSVNRHKLEKGIIPNDRVVGFGEILLKKKCNETFKQAEKRILLEGEKRVEDK